MKMNIDLSEFVQVETEQKVVEKLVNRVKMRRKEAKIIQQELAKRSGVSYGSIRRFESTGEISLSSLIKIANALNCLADFNEFFRNQIFTSLKDL